MNFSLSTLFRNVLYIQDKGPANGGILGAKNIITEDQTVEEINKKKPFTISKCYLMLPASLCDMAGTSLMYVALTLTSAASFQMIRGSYCKIK